MFIPNNTLATNSIFNFFFSLSFFSINFKCNVNIIEVNITIVFIEPNQLSILNDVFNDRRHRKVSTEDEYRSIM